MNQHAQNDAQRPGFVAGIDYGEKRLGVAIAHREHGIATPLTTYQRCGDTADARWFRRLVDEHDITQFVVGLPVHLDGHESAKSREARRFGQWLAEQTGRGVEFFDERFTTREAEAHLQQAGLTKKRRQARRDMLAAQIMLAGYLEAGGRGQESPGALDD